MAATTVHSASDAESPAAGEGPDAHRTSERMSTHDRLVLIVLLTASFTLAVDFSVLNVALPVIGADVGFSVGNLQWIATTFAICAAGFTLLFGRVGDIVGRKQLFLFGIALLGVSSLAGGLAQEPVVLLGARVLQGLATAMVTPTAVSLLTTSFAEGPVRQRALGLNGSLMAAGFTTGAILGGLLTDLLNWRWAFFINVIVAVGVLAIAPRVLENTRDDSRPRLDVPGAVLVTASLVAVVFGLTQAGESGWSTPLAWLPLIGGAVGLVGFAAVEFRVAEPLVPIQILRRRNIAWGNIAGIFAFVTETSLVFLLTLYLQNVLGYSALAAGLSFAVLGVGTVLGGIVGPKVIGALGAKTAMSGGLILQGIATLPLVFIGEGHGWIWVLLAATFVGGVANLVAIVGFMVSVTSGLADSEQGMASGLATMSQQVGMAMGIPIMSAIAAGRINGLGGDTPANVLSGVSLAILVNTVLCFVVAAAIALFFKSARVQAD